MLPIELICSSAPPWVFVQNFRNNKLIVSATPLKKSGIPCRTFDLLIWQEGTELKVSETSKNNRLPLACPERHVNHDGTFCLGLDVGKQVNSLDYANKWWSFISEFLNCQEHAEKHGVWPREKGLSHGSTAEMQLIAEKAAEKLGWLQEYRDAVEYDIGWLAGELPRTAKDFSSLINGRARCPKGCRNKNNKPLLRRECRHKEIIAKLIAAEHLRRRAEVNFITTFKNEKFQCCGTMKNCPFKEVVI